MSQFKVLAADIIEQQFSSPVSDVFKTLLDDGPLRFTDLCKLRNDISKVSCATALSLLVQHDCVGIACRRKDKNRPLYSQVAGSTLLEVPDYVVYEAIVDSVLFRSNFAVCVDHVRSTLGELESRLLGALFERGRSNLPALCIRLRDKDKAKIEDVNAADAFSKLMHNGLVITSVQRDADFFRRSGRSRKGLAANFPLQESTWISGRSDAIVPPAKKKRKDEDNTEEEEFGLAVPSLLMDYRLRLLSGGELKAELMRPDLVWLPNSAGCVASMRVAAVAAFAASHVGPNGAHVVSAVAQIARDRMGIPGPADIFGQADSTEVVSLREVMGGVVQRVSALGKEVKPSSIEDTIDKLNNYTSSRPRVVTLLDERRMRLNLSYVTKELKRRVIKAYVCARFGRCASRIFTLLTNKISYLEVDVIADKVMAPHAEVRRVLFALLRAGVVAHQELYKGQSDHVKVGAFYLWRVDTPGAVRRVVEETHKTILNLRARYKHEKLARAPATSGSETQNDRCLQLLHQIMQLNRELIVLRDFG